MDVDTETVEVLVVTPPTKDVQKLEAEAPSACSWAPARRTAGAGVPAGPACEDVARSRRAAVALNMVAMVGQDTEGVWRLKESGDGRSESSKWRECGGCVRA